MLTPVCGAVSSQLFLRLPLPGQTLRQTKTDLKEATAHASLTLRRNPSGGISGSTIDAGIFWNLLFMAPHNAKVRLQTQLFVRNQKMKLSKVLFAGFLMLALSAPTASVFAGDNWSKLPSTRMKAPNQTTVAPKQTTPSASLRCCTDLTDIFLCKRCIPGLPSLEMQRAEKLTGKIAGEGIKGGRGNDNLYKTQQGRPSIDSDGNGIFAPPIDPALIIKIR